MNVLHHLKRWLLSIAVPVLLFVSVNSFASLEWPQELSADEGTIVVYQPQPETLEGNTLSGRAAMSMNLKNKKDPIYGVFWFSAKVATDRGNDSATINDIKVTKVGWPDSKDAGEQRFTKVVEDKLENAIFEAKLSTLTASLTASDKVKKSLKEINNDAPKIVFREQLAVLLMYDGKPSFKAIGSDSNNSQFERAINTPLAVAHDTKGKKYYLFSGSIWYSSNSAKGPWQHTTTPPADLVATMPKTDDVAPTIIPAIVTATDPTELISTDGKPNWVSLEGGQLLYVKNTETPWLRDLSTGNMYILLSGRWYRSKNQNSKWTFVRADELPASFKEIPPGSDIGGLRTSVAGTDEAEQAVVDAQIPQTAAIQRSEAKLDVSYDGSPKFKQIKGTDVAYAINTSTQVLMIEKKYYAVDSGVWFVADSAKGPWVVADAIPTEKIAEIPPSSPVYNTTYVTIYDSTPEVVYVGYTPGYMWSYPYYGVPVYGTGWYYPPYYGHYYYPRPPTWGMHVGYNPWTGWNFGVSWGGPFFRVGVTWGGGYNHHNHCCGGGWYGGGYRNTHINHNTNININGDINIGNSISTGNRTKIENRNGDRLKNRPQHDNIYKRPENRQRNAGTSARKQQLQKARSNSQRRNDLFADQQGNVVRKNGDKWQQRSGDKWNSIDHAKPAQRPIQKSASSSEFKPQARPQQRHNFNQQQMNREHRARNMNRSGGHMNRGSGRMHR